MKNQWTEKIEELERKIKELKSERNAYIETFKEVKEQLDDGDFKSAYWIIEDLLGGK